MIAVAAPPGGAPPAAREVACVGTSPGIYSAHSVG